MSKKVSSEGIKEGIIKIIDGEPYYHYKYTDYLYQEIKKVNKEIERLNNTINELEKWLNKQLEDTNKCIDYATEYHNLQDTQKYVRDHNLFVMIIERLEVLKEGKENE